MKRHTDVQNWVTLPERYPEAALTILGLLLFVPFLGVVHLFDWDEINFAEAAREMLVTGDWLRVTIDYQPFWEKPPLFIWLQAISMSVFGVNEFAARLPNALIGVVTLVLLFRVGRQVFDARLGWLWALLYAGSFLPHFYFRSGIIDPLFNLFIFLGIVQLWRYHHHGAHWRTVVLGGVFCGLAILTKGPVALLLTGLTWGAVWLASLTGQDGARLGLPWWQGLVFMAASALAAALWFGVDIARNGPWFVQTFIEYQIRLLTTGDAGHSQPVYYHPLVLLVGCFPASVFVFSALSRRTLWGKVGSNGGVPMRTVLFFRWMAWLLIVVVTVFSLVQTKIIHYSSLAYFPLTGLAALTLHQMLCGAWRWRGYHTALLAMVGGLWVLALLALPTLGMLSPILKELVRHPATQAILAQPVSWSGLELLIGVGLAVALGFSLALRAQKDLKLALTFLLGGTMLTLSALLPVIVPRVEGYSQRAAITFYETYQGCDCYVQTLRFKSYGQYFYARRPKKYSSAGVGVTAEAFEQWALSGPIDKPAYLLTRLKDADRYAGNPELREIYRAGGFVGYLRAVPSSNQLAQQSLSLGRLGNRAVSLP